jgi:DnaA family protein
VKQLLLEIAPLPAPTFANFVVGRNAEVVDALARAGARQFGSSVAVIYLWGITGSGRSHLLAATSDAAKAAKALVYVADDVDGYDDVSQVALFNQINECLASHEGIVVTAGSVAPRDLPLRPELTSRLGSGLVFQVQPLTDAEKAAALVAHANARGFSLRPEVANYLLRHGRRDMPSLVATLDALDRHSLELGREITLPLLREIIQPELLSS